MADFSVSVIATVKNEAEHVERLIQSLLAQTRSPDEIVIVDGGSTDVTVEIINRFVARGAPIKLLVAEGSNISQGRNLAVREAKGDIIASTDAGVVLHSQWLSNLVAGFQEGLGNPKSVSVVSGFFIPDCTTVFEMAMGATVLPALAEIDPDRFLPSSRSVAFKRVAWEQVRGYPEWLDYCEDLVFDLNLQKAGHRFVFAADAVVYFKPRGNLKSFAKQYYLYARGDGKAGLWPKRHAVRYATYLLGPLVLLAGFWYKVLWLLLLFGAAAYLRGPYRRLLPSLPGYTAAEKVNAILLVPIIRVVGDLSKMAGYPVGVWWRLKNK